jgi:hypothetical protein
MKVARWREGVTTVPILRCGLVVVSTGRAGPPAAGQPQLGHAAMLSPPLLGELLLAPPATRGRVLVRLVRVLREHAGQLGSDFTEPGHFVVDLGHPLAQQLGGVPAGAQATVADGEQLADLA